MQPATTSAALEAWRKKWREVRDVASASSSPHRVNVPDHYPYSGIPSGWFQVAWSREIEIGAVKPLRYFGQELVAWRDMNGRLAIMDAYCRHMGAHLGYGGCVEGDSIRCPYHGWMWNAQGSNSAIPGTDRTSQTDKIQSWPVVETAGLVLVWHHPLGGAPSWDPPVLPEMAKERYDPFPDLTHVWRNLKIRPQFIVENTVDVRHQQWVHGSKSEHVVVDWSIDGPRCRSSQSLTFGIGKEKTWLTPTGPVQGRLDVDAYGIGLNIAHFVGTDDSIIVGAHTPVDEHTIDDRTTVYALREEGFEESPNPAALKRFAFHVRQVELDIVVWENMRYVDNPPYTPDEAKMWRSFRKWAKQFYQNA